MKKMIEIGMILVVLLSMVGFANASGGNVLDGMEIDIPTNTVSQYIVTYSPSTAAITEVTFAIYEQDTSTMQWTIPTSEVEGKLGSGDWATATSVGITTSNIVGDVGTWDFYIRDKDTSTDENDGHQVSKRYKVVFYCDSIPVLTDAEGTMSSFASGIPEFPTIALPVAAILGLAFIIQRRREEE